VPVRCVGKSQSLSPICLRQKRIKNASTCRVSNSVSIGREMRARLGWC
jgi:hypothetical protein